MLKVAYLIGCLLNEPYRRLAGKTLRREAQHLTQKLFSNRGFSTLGILVSVTEVRVIDPLVSE